MKLERFLTASVLALLVAGMAGTPALAQDGGDLELRAGLYVDDVDGPFVGIGYLSPIGDGGRWSIDPNAEIAFGDRVDAISASVDFLYDLRSDSTFTFWIGGGPTVIHLDPDFGDGDTDFGVNGVFRMGWRDVRYRPFFQVKAIVADESELVLGAGMRF